MRTECTRKLFEFEAVERHSVVAGFDGGNITSNAGALLLGQIDRGLGLVRRFADCFIDRRDPRYVEHQVTTLVGQRIFGLALGYEDLNDHDELRKDPTFAVLALKTPLISHTVPKTSVKRGCSCSMKEKRCISGPSQSSDMFGIRS